MTEQSKGAERLQKLIAQAGIASRRDAEDLIRDGMVTLNGKVAKLGDKATPGEDAIKVNGKLLHSTGPRVYYLVYKPKNVIAMVTEDEEGRPTLKDMMRRVKERVFPIGRMDFTGEGAILLTNDGELAQELQKSNDIIRRYHVKVDRHPTQEDLAKLARGGRIEGRSMHPFHVRVVESYNRNALIEISFEGMGALDIRKFFENKGFFPEKIARVGIGHISAEKMVPGTFKRLEASSVKALLAQPELARKAIEKLTEKAAKRAKYVKEEDLEQDAESKRRGRKGFFSDEADEKPKSAPRGFKVKGASAPRFSRDGAKPAGRSFSRDESRGKPAGRSFGRDDARPARSYGRDDSKSARSFGRDDTRPARSYSRDDSKPGRSFGRDDARPARSYGRDDARPARSYNRDDAKPARSFGRDESRVKPAGRSFGRAETRGKPAGRSFGRDDSRGAPAGRMARGPAKPRFRT